AGCSTPQRVNSGQEFLNPKRLHQIIVGAGIERLHFVVLRTKDADYQNRNVKDLSDSPTRFEAADPRHFQVEENHINSALGLNFVEGLFARSRFDDDVSRAWEGGTQSAPHLR